ncbi:MAG: 30S ribosomal protein S2 [Candidatus Pacearchaeota archaeon]|nr:30S ribosomal protein S2 [Candidatus Pacearchaeota archaeon]
MVKSKENKEKESKKKEIEIEEMEKETEKEIKIKEEKSDENKEKQQTKEGKEQESLLAPLEDYINAGVHLGTRAVTPDMRQYVYRRKADGVAVLNTKKIDEKINVAATFLAQYSPEDILFCCRRDAGSKAVEAFKNALELKKVFTRYPAGIITNPKLDDFFEPKVLFIVDPWLDKNALNDAVKIHIPIVALCDTNNTTTNIDVVVPCNNKTAASIGLVLYLIAKLYLEKRRIKKKLSAKDFYELSEEQKEKKTTKKKLKEELIKRIKIDEKEKVEKAEEQKAVEESNKE